MQLITSTLPNMKVQTDSSQKGSELSYCNMVSLYPTLPIVFKYNWATIF